MGEIDRSQVLLALQRGLEAFPYVIALWEAGASAFDRLDEWSDVDLFLVVNDEQVSGIFETVRSILEGLTPIELEWELPQPTWHGHRQCFWRLEGASPYLLVDLCVLQASADRRFLDRSRHGQARVLFDKCRWTEVGSEESQLDTTLQERRLELSKRMRLFGLFVEKEIKRGRLIDAVALYHTLILRPLVELLRARYDPARFDFGPRYLHRDLPTSVAEKLQPLWFVKDMNDLREKQRRAIDWFWELDGEPRQI